MQKTSLVLLGIVSILSSCSKLKPIGKRVSLAKGNVSFVLPDSSLIYSKPILWPADYKLSNYGESGSFYHNQDSSVIVSVYVNAFPDPEQRKVSWRIIANEKHQREILLAKNMNLAIIEQFAADSSARIVTIDYHRPKRPEKGWRGQASYEKDFTFYGSQRIIRFWFFAPDNAANRQAIAAACASVCINPTYLQAEANPYPSRQYRD